MYSWEVTSRCTRILVTFTLSAAFGVIGASPALALPGAPDQSTTFSGIFNVGVDATQSMAQTFTPSTSGSLTTVGLGLSKSGTVTNLTSAIYAATAGVPTGSSLASKTLTGSDLAAVPTGQTVFNVTFATPATVTAGSTYAIVTTTTDTVGTGGGDYRWYLSTPYANGNAAEKTSGPWTAAAYDLVFAVYIDAISSGDASAPITDEALPEPIQQQFGKPKTGACDDAQPTGLNWGGVADGGWHESWAQWVNDGKGGAVCTRMLVYSTSLARWTVG